SLSVSCCALLVMVFLFFVSTAPATSEIYTLSLHDALPISSGRVDAVVLRAQRREASDTAGRARARDRRIRGEPPRPRAYRARDRLPRFPLLARVQSRGQLHRRRRRRPARRAAGFGPRAAAAATACRVSAYAFLTPRRASGSTAFSPYCPRSARVRPPSGSSPRGTSASTELRSPL